MKKIGKQSLTIALTFILIFLSLVNANQILGDEAINNGEQTFDTLEDKDDASSVIDFQIEFEGDVLTKNELGIWAVTLNADKEHPLTYNELLENLPKNVYMTNEGIKTTVPISWDLTNYGDSQYEGAYTILAIIPEEIPLPEGFSYDIEVKIQFTGVEALAVTDDKLNSHVINTVSPNGTTIDLFNYKGIDETSGINNGKTLKFNTGRIGESGYTDKANVWTGYFHTLNNNKVGDQPFTKMIKNKLQDGYPVTQNAQSDLKYIGTGNNNSNPYTGLKDNESLDYLFDHTQITDAKQVYKDVGGLLKVNDTGYYTYDSSKNFAIYDESKNEFIVYDQPGVKMNVANAQLGNFFPFTSKEQVKSSVFIDEIGGQLIANENLMNNGAYDYHFGVHMSTRFIQENGGIVEVNDQQQAVTYEFTGDDDVWVFIDGVLVADLGGIHDAISLKMNFATGDIEIGESNNQDKYYKTSTLYEMFNHAGEAISTEWSNQTFKDGTYHTLDFFYLERGAGASNMKLTYNLVEIPESDVIKVDQLGNPVPGASFNLYKTDSQYSYDSTTDLIASGTTDNNGEFILTTKDENGHDKLLSLNELYTDGVRNLLLVETRTPKGYRSNDACKLRLISSETTRSVILISDNYWETGTFSSAKLRVELPNNIYQLGEPNTPININTYKNGTVFAVIQKYKGEANVDELSKESNWDPISGNRTDGWNIEANGEFMERNISAAKRTGLIFQPSSSGAYKLDIEDLPGDVQYYYSILENAEKHKTEYAVGYYYTDGPLEEATAQNTFRLDSDGVDDSEHLFKRTFASNLLVPNIKNYIMAQKIDEKGVPIERPATFALFQEEQLSGLVKEITDTSGNTSYVIDGDISNVDIYMQGTTKNVSQADGYAIDLESAVVFPDRRNPDHSDKVLESGKSYYLVEMTAPTGYARNLHAVKFTVTNDGVFANAGTEDDDIGVARGVGSLVKTLGQFAYNHELDATLHDITARLVTNSDINQLFADLSAYLNASDEEWEENSTSFNKLHLEYKENKAETNLEYGPTLEGSPNGFFTQTGWSGVQIKQCLNGHNDDHSHVKINDLGAQILNNLYSGTVTIVVTDKKIVDLEIQKDLTDTGNHYLQGTPQEFKFNITLKDDAGKPYTGTFLMESYDANNQLSSSSQTMITFDSEGKAQITLLASEDDTYNPKVIIKGLPNALMVDIEEEAVLGFDTSIQYQYDLDTLQEENGREITLDLDQNQKDIDKATVIYTNNYNNTQFVFTKVRNDGSPLADAQFNVYHLVCDNANHDHDELIDDDTTCWILVNENPLISNEDGIVSIQNMVANEEYRLVEILAPNEYVTPKGQWKISYNKDDNCYEFDGSIGNPPGIETDGDRNYKLYNYKENELPITGSDKKILFAFMGTTFMVIGATIYILNRKRRVRNT